MQIGNSIGKRSASFETDTAAPDIVDGEVFNSNVHDKQAHMIRKLAIFH